MIIIEINKSVLIQLYPTMGKEMWWILADITLVYGREAINLEGIVIVKAADGVNLGV